MKKCYLFLFVLVFLCTSAQAYQISFDPTGTGDPNNLVEMDEWDLAPYSEYNSDAETMGDLFAYQDGSGAFQEQFTMRVDEGRNSVNGESTSFPPFYVDAEFFGQYFSDENIQFNNGSIVMYDDTQYSDKSATGQSYPREYTDGTDPKIAELSLTSALASELSGSLLADDDELGMKLDLKFTFTDVNPLYFGDDEVDLVGESWLLSVLGGRIEQENIWGSDELDALSGDELLIEWDAPSMQAEFEAVPEPTTLLLFGTGLLGLAAFGRKKFMKKS